MERNISLPEGWSWVKINDVIDKIPLTGLKLPQGKYLDRGKYPVVDQGQKLVGGYSNEELVVPCKLPVIIFGDHTKAIKYIDFPFIAGADGIKVIKPSSIYFPKLFFYFLHVIELPDKGYARHFQFLEKECIPLPPLPEQERIVAKIEALFTQLDAGTAGLKRIQAGLKRYKASVLKAACEGRLVAQDPSDEPAGALLAPLGKKPLEGEGLPTLPAGWEWITWETILSSGRDSFRRGPFGSALKKSMFVDQGFKVYEQYCPINDDCSFGRYYITPEYFEQMRGFEVLAGDYLISCSGTLGRITRVPEGSEKGIINQALLRVRINDRIIYPDYFLHYFRSDGFQQQLIDSSTGTAIQNVKGVKELKALQIPLPPINEQQRIVVELERQFSVMQELEQAMAANLQRAGRMRQAILKHAFEGRLV